MKLITDWQARSAADAPSRFAMLGWVVGSFGAGALFRFLEEDYLIGGLLAAVVMLITAVGIWAARNDGIDYWLLKDAPSKYDSIQQLALPIGSACLDAEGRPQIQISDEPELVETLKRDTYTTFYVMKP